MLLIVGMCEFNCILDATGKDTPSDINSLYVFATKRHSFSQIKYTNQVWSKLSTDSTDKD